MVPCSIPLSIILAAVGLMAGAQTEPSAPQTNNIAAKRQFWYTYSDPSGNRIVAGRGTFPDSFAVDIKVDSTIAWSIGTSHPTLGFRFVVTTRSGRAYSVEQAPSPIDKENYDKSWRAVPLEGYSPLSAYQPPLVRSFDEHEQETDLRVVSLPGADMSPLSHPVPALDEMKHWFLYISSNGDVVLWDELTASEVHRITGIGALPDGRIARSQTSDDSSTLVALYGGSTNAYRHCVLGDCTESSRLILIRINKGKMAVETDVALNNGAVFEGLNPFFLPNGTTIVTTVANAGIGAWLQTYELNGKVLSVGPRIGWGWRHMLCYNNFGFNPQKPLPLLVDVLTPHVLMKVEFFDISKPVMEMRASSSKFTTHAMNSRYLDTAISADLNGDCINEAIVQDSDQRSLVGIQLKPKQGVGRGGVGVEAVEIWRVALPGKLSSNLAAVSSADGLSIAVGAASGNVFRMWLPNNKEGSNMDTDSTSTSPSMQPNMNRINTSTSLSTISMTPTLRPMPTYFSGSPEQCVARKPPPGRFWSDATSASSCFGRFCMLLGISSLVIVLCI